MYIKLTNLLIQCLEILLLADFEKNLHGVAIVIHSGKPRQILLNLIPVAIQDKLLKVLYIEKQSWFLLKPIQVTKNINSKKKIQKPILCA